jgi:hypothetical protein
MNIFLVLLAVVVIPILVALAAVSLMPKLEPAEKGPTMVKFPCSVCAQHLAVKRLEDGQYELLAADVQGQWQTVGACPRCRLDYPQAALEWRHAFHRGSGESEMIF